MKLDEIQLDSTGLLFFDMVRGFSHSEEMVTNGSRLAKAGRDANIPIFFPKMNSRSDSATGSTLLTDTNIRLEPWPNGEPQKMGWANGRPPVFAGDSSSEVIPELDPRPDDYYVPKYRWNAFFQTYLDVAFRARGIDTVIISGGSTEIGITATVFGGRDMDYNFIVVRDACASSHSAKVHDMLMDFVFPRMGRVRTTDQVLDMIDKARG